MEIEFREGVPVKLNGRALPPHLLIEELNKRGGENGVGRVDMVENRLVGIKSREIYEAPAATILHAAHHELEKLNLDKDTLHFKTVISSRYAELVYNGLWLSPLRQALDSFVDETQKFISGKIRIRLYKGTCQVVGRESPYSLYEKRLATYTEEDIFDQKASKGFIEIWGLPLKTLARLRKSQKEEK